MTSSSRSQRGLDWRINLLSQVANEVKNVRVSCGASNMLEAEVYIIKWGKQRFFLVGARAFMRNSVRWEPPASAGGSNASALRERGDGALQRSGKSLDFDLMRFSAGIERSQAFSAGLKSSSHSWSQLHGFSLSLAILLCLAPTAAAAPIRAGPSSGRCRLRPQRTAVRRRTRSDRCVP